jgi:hypothetical protein
MKKQAFLDDCSKRAWHWNPINLIGARRRHFESCTPIGRVGSFDVFIAMFSAET